MVCLHAFGSLDCPTEMAELTGPSEQNRVSILAKTALNRSLNESEAQAVYRAHLVGLNQPGVKAGGARPNNFTFSQLREKRNILSRAGFAAKEIRLLMEKSVVGVDLDGLRLAVALDPKDLATRSAIADLFLEMGTPEAQARGNLISASLALKSRPITAANRRRYQAIVTATQTEVDRQLRESVPEAVTWTWKDGFLDTVHVNYNSVDLDDPAFLARVSKFLLNEGRTAAISFTSEVVAMDQRAANRAEARFIGGIYRLAYENELPGVVKGIHDDLDPHGQFFPNKIGADLPFGSEPPNRSYLKILANALPRSTDRAAMNYVDVALAVYHPDWKQDFPDMVDRNRKRIGELYQRSESFRDLILEGMEKDPNKFRSWKEVLEIKCQTWESDIRNGDLLVWQIESDLAERSIKNGAKKRNWASPENVDLERLVYRAIADAAVGHGPRAVDSSKLPSPRSASPDYLSGSTEAIGDALEHMPEDSLIKLAPYLRPIDEFMTPNSRWHSNLPAKFIFVNWVNGKLTPQSFQDTKELLVPKNARAVGELTAVLSNHMLAEKNFELMGVVEGSVRSLKPSDLGYQTGLSALKQIANNRGHAKQVPAIQSLGRLARAGNVPAKEALQKLRTEPIWNSLSNEVKTKINAVLSANP